LWLKRVGATWQSFVQWTMVRMSRVWSICMAIAVLGGTGAPAGDEHGLMQANLHVDKHNKYEASIVQLKTELDMLKRRLGLDDEPPKQKPAEDKALSPGSPPPSEKSSDMLDNRPEKPFEPDDDEPRPPGTHGGPPPAEMTGEIPFGNQTAHRDAFLQTSSGVAWTGLCTSCRKDMYYYGRIMVQESYNRQKLHWNAIGEVYGSGCGAWTGIWRTQWVYFCMKPR